jgi:hypothetical protein
MITVNANAGRSAKITARQVELRTQFWPDIDESELWHRKRATGFTTVPRTMPLVMRIMDSLTSGKPVSAVYLDLWCRAPDEAILSLEKAQEMAFSSGFTGERGVGTWSTRLDILASLGFIKLAEGQFGKRSYALLLNPHLVVQRLKKKVSSGLYNALLSRANSIGATDLKPPAKP